MSATHFLSSPCSVSSVVTRIFRQQWGHLEQPSLPPLPCPTASLLTADTALGESALPSHRQCQGIWQSSGRGEKSQVGPGGSCGAQLNCLEAGVRCESHRREQHPCSRGVSEGNGSRVHSSAQGGRIAHPSSPPVYEQHRFQATAGRKPLPTGSLPK